MDKKKQMNFNLNNFLLATTEILDTHEIQQKNISKHHSLRVAFISLKIAEKLNYEPKMMFDLCAYSLFHNYINSENLKLLNIENNQNSLSQLVDIVHSFEERYDFGAESIENRSRILQELQSLDYESNIKNIFLDIVSPLEFWLDCQNSNQMLQYIYSSLYDFTVVLSFEEILKITSMFGSLYEDVNDFVKKCEISCDYFHFEHKDKMTFLIAASMRDFGKLAISKELIMKKDILILPEYEIIKSNIYYNKNALKQIYGFEDITKWATRHQERLDGQGYPSAIGANHLSLKDRLMGVLHIYNALLQNRPYRNALSNDKIVNVLAEKAKNNQIDKALVEEIKIIFQI
ncbi:MAG: HD domain-containing phosphohydrolase [Arcobacteraceae bacterium]